MRYLYRGKWILLGHGNSRELLKDGALLVEDGVIIQIGKYQELRKNYDFDNGIGNGDHIIMPGLVNAHTHGRGLTMLQRGLKDQPLELYVLHSRPSVDTYFDTLLAALRHIQSGTTCVVHNHALYRGTSDYESYVSNMEDALRAYSDTKLKVIFFPNIDDANHLVYQQESFIPTLPPKLLEALDLPDDSEIMKRVDAYFETCDRLIRKYHQYEQEIFIGLAPRGPQWCSDNLLLKIKEKASRMELPIQTHLLETKYQKAYGFREFRKSLVEHLDEINFLGSEVSCAHCVWISKDDINLLKKNKTSVVHNPSSNLRLFSGIAPISEMVDNDMIVALGTDGLSISDNDSLFEEARLCSLLQRKPGIQSTSLDSNILLDMMTINGSKAVGLENQIGSLEIGKQADLLFLNRRVAQLATGANLLDLILFQTRLSDIDMVIINGEIAAVDGHLVNVEEATIFNEIKKSLAQLQIEEDDILNQLKSYVNQHYLRWDEGPI